MSYSLALDSNGDLKPSGSSFAIVSGTNKLEQDLDIWMRERIGIDRFHPTYGSLLDEFVGTYVSNLSVTQIKSEAVRVISNYQRTQAAAFSAKRDKFTLNELLQTVNSVTARQDFDTIRVGVRMITADNTRVATTLETGLNG